MLRALMKTAMMQIQKNNFLNLVMYSFYISVIINIFIAEHYKE